MDTLLGALGLALALVALVVTFLIEWLKRPRLKVRRSVFRPSGPLDWTFAAVRVWNDPRMPLGLGRLLTRQSADGCEVTLEFRKCGLSGLALPSLPGRWSSQPEPLRQEPVAITPQQSGGGISLAGPTPTQIGFVQTFDLGMAMEARRQNVGAAYDGEEVAIAVLKSDGRAFAWGAESYAYPGWEHPEWELERGTYEVTVRVRGSGVSRSRRFELEFLSGDFATFTLRPLDKQE